MSDRPQLLDLFCGAGGAAMGYHRAGFEVVGVDVDPQPNYPFAFIQADAMTYPLEGFDVVHASPPCQRYSVGTTAPGARTQHPDLLPATRARLISSGLVYIIENVPGAPMNTTITLCGEAFGLRVIRHRLFESNAPLSAPLHVKHRPPYLRAAADGTNRTVRRSYYAQVAGNGGESYSYRLADWRNAMGINWMTRSELVEAIPPAYTEWIGGQLRYVTWIQAWASSAEKVS